MTAARQFTNAEVAARLRDVAAALRMRGVDRFQPAAYEKAAHGVETHPDALVRLWEGGRLRDISGVGGSISQHLDELFRTGAVGYWQEMTDGIPEVIFELLRIPGVGQVTAWKLARGGVEDLEDLERRLEGQSLVDQGFTPKALASIRSGLDELNRRPDAMLLPAAEALALPLIAAVRAWSGVERADLLGGIRRRAPVIELITIGIAGRLDAAAMLELARDLPAVATVERLAGDGVALTLHGGRRVELRAAPPERYGALIVWHTGSEAHTGALTHRAAERGFALKPAGMFDASDSPVATPEETDIYRLLDLSLPPPELREDRGELAFPAGDELPTLLTLADLRGDCHTHSCWSDGRDSLAEMAAAARARGHAYLVITDHSYPTMDFAARARELEDVRRQFPEMQIVNGLEVNITVDAGLQVPDEVLAAHQFCLASIHTGFRQPREQVTARLLAALRHPFINGIAHPTGRLLLRREGVEADWDAVFTACLENDRFLEIDGPEDRLDLPDDLVREAARRGVKLTVDSDAHATEALSLQASGVEVARRGWVEPRHVLNTLPWPEFVRAARVRGV